MLLVSPLFMDYLGVHPSWNIHWLESQYETWKNKPASLPEGWASWFQSLEDSLVGDAAVPSPHHPAPTKNDNDNSKSYKILSAYRQWGHLQARFNPLRLPPTPSPFLSFKALGIRETDLACTCSTSSEPSPKPLRRLLYELEAIYCGPLGYVYTHIQDPERLEWLQTAIESRRFAPKLDRELCLKVLDSLLQTEALDDTLDSKFRGQKRFSLEGLNALIPALRELLELCAENGIYKAFIGATHRGRISLLAHVLAKPLDVIFREFLDIPQQTQDTTRGSGDVKYHLGWDATYRSAKGTTLDVHLCPNPSHLEAVLPVLQGKVRAWQDDNASKASLALVLHGEAAFVGQGIVAETLNLSQLEGYTTQGTLHVILNNQIGFTTLPPQGRSSRYSGDLVKAIDAPLLLVNGENLPAVLEAFHLAFAYQQAFGRDICIELYGYRRAGHNEIDEPSFTQPELYPALSERPRLSHVFQAHMATLGISLDAEALHLQKAYQQTLDAAFNEARSTLGSTPLVSRLEGVSPAAQPSIQLENAVLEHIRHALWTVPKGFTIQPKLAKQLEAKKKAFPDNIDWSLAEALALGSLLQDGFSIRLTGQDAERGTFSQRHAIWHDSLTGKTYCPLASLAREGARVSIHNAPLSEAAALGFEYGYSTVSPHCLTLWEAQFGDFVNGAQVILDQFISTAESKWDTQSRLVLLLPHGHQGQGPDHSSARVERFLQACADNNLQVCNPTTPAQYFHVLRRQMHQSHAKPLVLFTPKNLFRHKACVSSLQDLVAGSFRPVLPAAEGPYIENKAPPKAVLLCSGKIYYELLAYGEEHELSLPILRLEQLYPLATELLESHLAAYAPSTPLLWVQEEPKNMGAWSYIAPLLAERGRPLLYIGRPAAASVACGRASQHQMEQVELLSRAYEGVEGLSS